MVQPENFLLGITSDNASFGVSFSSVCCDSKSLSNINSRYRCGHVSEWYPIECIKYSTNYPPSP